MRGEGWLLRTSRRAGIQKRSDRKQTLGEVREERDQGQKSVRDPQAGGNSDDTRLPAAAGGLPGEAGYPTGSRVHGLDPEMPSCPNRVECGPLGGCPVQVTGAQRLTTLALGLVYPRPAKSTRENSLRV